MNLRTQLWAVLPSMLCVALQSGAQTPDNSVQPSIVYHIEQSGFHELVIPDDVRLLLLPSANASQQSNDRRSTMRTYWRVQVFSDSKGEKSHQEGQQKRSAVARRFPEYPIELKWDSPYWQLRVGKFVNREEAESAAEKIKKAFPSYSREVHVVRQRMREGD